MSSAFEESKSIPDQEKAPQNVKEDGLSFSKEAELGSLPGTDQELKWTAKGVIAMISLCGVWVGAQIPLYFVGGSLQYIVEDLGRPAVASWITVSYTLAIGAVAPFCGYLADILGQRWVILVGSAFILIGLIVVGTAHGFSQACAGMTIIGVGAAIAELTALAGISAIVPVKKRGFYLAICTAFLLPWTPYVLYSQLLSTRSTWRWGMWICLIYNGICAVGLLTTYFPVPFAEDRKPVLETLRKIDYLGAFLSITGLTLFLVALGSGGYTHPWGSAYVLCTLILGIALFAAFVLWEARFAANPMVPGKLFRGNRVLCMAFLVAFVGGMNLYSLLNFYPLTFEDVFNPDPVTVGIRGLGYGISVTAGATIINALLDVFKKHNRELLVFSTVLMTAFGAALAAVNPGTPRLAVALGTIAGFGVGGSYIPPATIALTAAPEGLLATTVAMSLCIRTVGGSVGYTIYYNVFANHLKVLLPDMVAAAAEKAGMPPSDVVGFVTAFASSPAAAMGLPGATPGVIEAATLASRQAYASSLSYVWYVSIAFGVCAIAASAFLGDVSKYMTNRVTARIR